jgi:hypothetical protein
VWLLEKKSLQKAKVLVPKTLACADSAHTAGWMAWYRGEIFLAFAKRTARQKQGFEFKVS